MLVLLNGLKKILVILLHIFIILPIIVIGGKLMPVDSVVKVLNYQLEPTAETSNRNRKEQNNQNEKNKGKEEQKGEFQKFFTEIKNNCSENIDIYRQSIDTTGIVKLLMMRPNPALFQNKTVVFYLKNQIEAKNRNVKK